MNKVVLFGGSFNPVHLEHVNAVKKIIDGYGVDKVIVVPANIPPHKKNAVLASGKDRIEMLKIAFADVGKVEVSDFELEREGESYSYITVSHFAEKFKGDELFFLVGTDMLYDFATWKNPEIILRKARLIAVSRKGESDEEALKVFNGKFGLLYAPVMTGIRCDDTSSTKIRNYVALGLSTSGILDEKVRAYIDENGLYDLGDFSAFVQKSLPIRRLTHTAGVMTLAESYAKTLKEDAYKARLAAMLHDVAKYMKADDFIGFKLPDNNVPDSVVHQFLGAYVCENVLKISDYEILNAIKFHTTGRPSMTTLEKIIFLADLLEEGRTFPGVDDLRKAVNEDFEKGFCRAVKELYGFLLDGGGEVYHLTKDCYEYYVKNVK